MLSVDGNWVDPADTADNVAWVREVISQVEGFSVAGGTYLNFSGQEESAAAEVVQAAYGDNLQKLAEVQEEVRPRQLVPAEQQRHPSAIALPTVGPAARPPAVDKRRGGDGTRSH